MFRAGRQKAKKSPSREYGSNQCPCTRALPRRSAPIFLTIPFLAARSPLAGRIALPLIGTFDTLFETKLFGSASGTELYFAACMMLVALSFQADEKWWQRGMALVLFCRVCVFAQFYRASISCLVCSGALHFLQAERIYRRQPVDVYRAPLCGDITEMKAI